MPKYANYLVTPGANFHHLANLILVAQCHHSHSFVLLIVAATTYTHLYPNPDHMYVSTEAQECMDEFQTIVQPSLSLHTLHATLTDRDRQTER